MTCVATFYRFHPLGEIGAMRAAIERACSQRALRGTVLLAPEGINATLAGSRRELADLIDGHFPDADVKWSTAAPGNPVFHRLKVRERAEIVSFGRPLPPSAPKARHVNAVEWHKLLADPDVLVVDVRNDYESDVGTFRGVTRAATAHFREFPEFVDRELAGDPHPSIAMFCTGGIRCEKASAYLLEQGFEDIRQLDGGILKYLAETQSGECAFEGECFVFDQRVSVTRDLGQGTYALCRACGWPLSPEARQSPRYAQGTSCPACHGRIDPERRAGFEERACQERLAAARGERHVGAEFVEEGEC